MNQRSKEVLSAVGASVTGGGIGAAVYVAIGGVGLTAVGTGFGITLGPFIAVGVGIGAAGYGLVWVGKKIGKKHVSRNAVALERAMR